MNLSALNRQDLVWCVRRLPRSVTDLMKTRRVFLAGGFIRSCIANEPVNDVDLFSPSKEDAEASAKLLDGPIISTDNAFTVLGTSRFPVQFIHRWTFANPEDVIPSFDFTIARSAIWCRDGQWMSACDPNFYADLAAKRLTYCSPVREEEPGGSMLRVLKFYQKGYRIPLDSLGAIIARLSVAVDKEIAPGGAVTEEWVAKIVTGLLHAVDPNIDPTHDAHLPNSTEATGETT